MLEEHGQDSEGLLLESDPLSVLAQLARTKVRFEHPETEPSTNRVICLHGELNLDSSDFTTSATFRGWRGGDRAP
jgi:hypothetical protein